MRRRFVLRAVKGIGSCQQMSAGCQRMTRGGRRMLCRAMADGLRWAGGQMACREPTDAAQGPEDGLRRDGGWFAARWRMLCRGLPDATQNDGRWLAGGRQMLCRVLRWFVTRRQVARRGSKDGAPEAIGWCVKGRRVANRRRSGAIFSPLEL